MAIILLRFRLEWFNGKLSELLSLIPGLVHALDYRSRNYNTNVMSYILQVQPIQHDQIRLTLIGVALPLRLELMHRAHEACRQR